LNANAATNASAPLPPERSMQAPIMRAPRQWLPKILLATAAILLTSGYIFLCHTVGKTFQTEYASSIESWTGSGLLTFGEPEVHPGLFSTRIVTPAKIKTGWGTYGLNVKTFAKHTPIPFGKGWGRFISSETVIELDKDSVANWEKNERKPPKALFQYVMRLNMMSDFDLRVFPFQYKAGRNEVRLDKTARIRGNVDLESIVRAFAVDIPAMTTASKTRTVSIKGFKFRQKSDVNASLLSHVGKLQLDSIAIIPHLRFRSPDPVSINRLSLITRGGGINKAALVTLLNGTTDIAENGLSARSGIALSAPALKLLQDSPQLQFRVEKAKFETVEGLYQFEANLGLTPNPKQIMNPLKNLKLNLSLDMPSSGVEKMLRSFESKASIKKFVNAGWLKKNGSNLQSEVVLENQNLKINGRPATTRSLQTAH
jgi:hypothetical protein